uniref:Tetratricopeptide repeat protein n=1 Tax=Heterorhabditis bacteriophora TaxID=37862 RepID=A0A1I7WNV2_HETBA
MSNEALLAAINVYLLHMRNNRQWKEAFLCARKPAQEGAHTLSNS